MNNYDKFEKKTLSKRIQKEILEYIQENKLGIGDKLPNEFELAMLFNVGRSTIRESISMLNSQGILEVRRGAGTFIINTETTINDPLGLKNIQDDYKMVLDLVDIRLMVEPEIAALAARNITEEGIKELVEQCEKVESYINQGKNHIREDLVLHTLIARHSCNKVVENLIHLMHSSIYLFTNIAQENWNERTILAHRDIVSAIVNRDEFGAKCAMISHLAHNRNELQELKREAHKE